MSPVLRFALCLSLVTLIAGRTAANPRVVPPLDAPRAPIDAATVHDAAAIVAPEPARVATARRAECTSHNFEVDVSASSVELVCDRTWNCHARLDVVVRNCTDAGPAGVTVNVFSPTDVDPTTAMATSLPPLDRGMQDAGQLFFRRTGHYVVTTNFLTGLGGARASIVRTVHVRNTAWDRARSACRACRGEWGRHGMLGAENCLCRTHDGGRVCDDGDDCEGVCLAVGARRVRPATAGPRGRDGIVGLGRPALYRHVGRCSEFVMLFGCHSVIASGASRERAQPALTGPDRQCAD